MDVIIYHNRDCGTSRNTLGLIRNAGVEPHIIEYLKCPPTRLLLRQLIGRMGLNVRDVLREKGTPFHELRLSDPSLTDEQLLDAMMAHPILINRPIVVSPKGVKALQAIRGGDRPSSAATRSLHQGGWRARDRRARPPSGNGMNFSLSRRLAAEALGTGTLVATVVGSGIMAETLTHDVALALLANTLATGAILVVLITVLGPVSGAHFNPAVSLVFALKGELAPREALALHGRADPGRHRGDDRGASHVCPAHSRCVAEGPDRRRAMVRRSGWQPSVSSSRFSPAFASSAKPCLGSSGSTSPRLIGSPPPRPSPIRP